MNFSFTLALITWLQSWIEEWRKQVSHKLIEQKLSQVSRGIRIVRVMNDNFEIKGLNLSHLLEFSEMINYQNKFSRESTFTTILKTQIEKTVWVDHEQRYMKEAA